MVTNKVPDWAKEMISKFRSGVSHMFLLSLNVGDITKKSADDGYLSVKRYIVQELLPSVRIVVFYDVGDGIQFASKKMEEDFRCLTIQDAKERAKPLPKNPEAALPLIGRLLEMNLEQANKIVPAPKGKDLTGLAAVIIGYSEALAPTMPFENMNSTDRSNVVMLCKWARNSSIANSGNVVIMMANNAYDVNSCLRLDSSNVESIKIPYPDQAERKEFLGYLKESNNGLKLGNSVTDLAVASSGLSLVTVEDLAKRVANEEIPLSTIWIWDKKKGIISDASGGLIQISKPRVGFEVIGGLKLIKAFFIDLAAAIKEGDYQRVPNGVLFLGPPGTGKSVLAEALAYELGYSYAVLRNIMEKWVGQSERNQNMVYDLLLANSPALVFEDEIDQREQMRGQVYHGDSGVSARMAARKAEYMADTKNRGKLLWIAATNRPDLMDPAMLRAGRYDVIIPFLMPEEDERFEIAKAILLKMSLLARESGNEIKYNISDAEFRELAKITDGFSGAEIETICHRAYNFSRKRGSKAIEYQDLKTGFDDFVSSKNLTAYEYMTDLALFYANSASLIPPKYLERSKQLKQLEQDLFEKGKKLEQLDDRLSK